MAVLVGGAIWSIWIKKTGVPVPQAPTAQRMKVPPMPESRRMKIPPTPSQTEYALPPAKPGQAQTDVTPVTPAVMPDPSPLREAIDAAAIPAPQLEKETPEAVTVDKTPPSDTTAGDTPAPEMAEITPSAQAPSKTPPSGTPKQKTPQPAAESATITERFNLQVGAYRVEANAREAMAKFSKKGYIPFILEISDARQRTWYTVRIGRYESHEKATASLEDFKRKEKIAAVIANAGKL